METGTRREEKGVSPAERMAAAVVMKRAVGYMNGLVPETRGIRPPKLDVSESIPGYPSAYGLYPRGSDTVRVVASHPESAAHEAFHYYRFMLRQRRSAAPESIEERRLESDNPLLIMAVDEAGAHLFGKSVENLLGQDRMLDYWRGIEGFPRTMRMVHGLIWHGKFGTATAELSRDAEADGSASLLRRGLAESPLNCEARLLGEPIGPLVLAISGYDFGKALWLLAGSSPNGVIESVRLADPSPVYGLFSRLEEPVHLFGNAPDGMNWVMRR